jgi:holo-[acyl-carrier protein] synthase
MIVGLGIDLERIDRFGELLERWGERFTRKLFTDRERSACEQRARPAQHYAARFAAKEAALKAMGDWHGQGLDWHLIEVVNQASGAPTLELHGNAATWARHKGASRWHLSLTHSPDSACAVVILEREPG